MRHSSCVSIVVSAPAILACGAETGERGDEGKPSRAIQEKPSPCGEGSSFPWNVGPQPLGDLAAHEVSLLTLLPSGPDVVREAPLRETQALRPDLPTEREILYHVSAPASISPRGAAAICTCADRRDTMSRAARRLRQARRHQRSSGGALLAARRASEGTMPRTQRTAKTTKESSMLCRSDASAGASQRRESRSVTMAQEST